MALDYFEPALMDEYVIIDWEDDYSAFVSHLVTYRSYPEERRFGKDVGFN
jgi:hypothetical protein